MLVFKNNHRHISTFFMFVWIGLGWICMDLILLEWVGLEWSVLEWRGLRWNGLEWRGLRWVEWECVGVAGFGVEGIKMEWVVVELRGGGWVEFEWSGGSWSVLERSCIKFRAMRQNCYGTRTFTGRLRLFWSGTFDWGGGNESRFVWSGSKE